MDGATSLWVRYTEADGEGPRILQCEVARKSDKHRIKPENPSRPEDIFSLHALPVLIDIMRTGGPNEGVLRILDLNITIGDVVIESCTRIRGEISTLILMTRGNRFEELLHPDNFAIPLRRRVALSHASELNEQVILPTLNLAGAVAQEPDLALSQSFAQQISRLKKKVAEAAERAIAVRIFSENCAAVLPAFDTTEPKQLIPQSTARLAAPQNASCVINMSRASISEPWRVNNLAASGLHLQHKLIFLKPQTLAEIFGEPLQTALETTLSESVSAPTHEIPILLHNGPGYLIDGCSVLSGGGARDLSASIKFCRFYGIPDSLKCLGPWPREAPEERSDSPNSLLHQGEAAIALCSKCLDEITPNMSSTRTMSTLVDQIRFAARILSSNLALDEVRPN